MGNVLVRRQEDGAKRWVWRFAKHQVQRRCVPYEIISRGHGGRSHRDADGAALGAFEEGQVDERLAIHAQRLDEQVQNTRFLIGRLKVPSYEEWREEEQRVDAQRIG